MLRRATVGSLDTYRLGIMHTRHRLCAATMHNRPRFCFRRPLCAAVAAGAASGGVLASAPAASVPAMASPPQSRPVQGEGGWGWHSSNRPQRTDLPRGQRRQAVARKRPDAPLTVAEYRDGARASVVGVSPPQRRGGEHQCAAAAGGVGRRSRHHW